MSRREAGNETEMGPKRYRERIHKESKFADDWKSLPFKFSKPKKDKPLNTYYECKKCRSGFCVGEDAIIVICSHCRTLNKVKEVRKKGL